MTQHAANESIYNFLAQRHSAALLVEPKPSRPEIERILQVAATVPDHGALKPYRFVVIEGEARETFAEALLDAAHAHRPGGLDEGMKPKIKAKAFAAPLQIVIIFSPKDSPKIPRWEQMAAASCTGYALDLAANALGYGSVWKNFAYDPGPKMTSLFGLRAGEEVLGWVNVGTERDRDRTPRSPVDIDQFARFI